MSFPSTPMTGKNGKVLISSNDGSYLSLAVMTKQAAYTYKGESFANRIYLLGAGKTLVNIRPAVEPRLYLDGIADGLVITPTTSNDEVAVSAGNIVVDGVTTTVAADASVTVTRPAATQGAWVAIHVNKSTLAISATKGTDTADAGGKTGLLSTYGSGAGQRPLIPTTDLLIGLIQLTNGTAKVLSTEISYSDREVSDVDIELLPNIGGAKITTALVAMHTGSVARDIKFTGYFLDDVMSEIGTAKEWTLAPSSSTITDTTMGRNVTETNITGWSFTFSQLATDSKVVNTIMQRQGRCAVRLQYPNGGYWQGVGSVTPTFANSPTAFCSISVSGALADDPTLG